MNNVGLLNYIVKKNGVMIIRMNECDRFFRQLYFTKQTQKRPRNHIRETRDSGLVVVSPNLYPGEQTADL